MTWQPLPHGIEGVYVAPDGRCWYQLSSFGGRTGNILQVKERLAREFSQQEPQIAGAELLLVEPGGRAWFYHRTQYLIWGYDGRQWTEYAIGDAIDGLAGRCASRGSLLNGSQHRSAGGKTWLIGRRGVYLFDGQQWSYRWIPMKGQVNIVHCVFSPDGSAAVACASTGETLHVWRAAQWAEHPGLIPTSPFLAWH